MTDSLKERHKTLPYSNSETHIWMDEALARIEELRGIDEWIDNELSKVTMLESRVTDRDETIATLQGKLDRALIVLKGYARYDGYIGENARSILSDLSPKAMSEKELESRDGDCRGIPASPEATVRLAVDETAATDKLAEIVRQAAELNAQGKAEGLEEAAKIVDGRIANWKVGTGTCRLSLLAECEDIAAAIRSRIKDQDNS